MIGQASFAPAENRTCSKLCDLLSAPKRRTASACHTLRYSIAQQNRSIESIVWHRLYPVWLTGPTVPGLLSLSLSAGLERLTRPHNRKKPKKTTTALSPSTPLAFYNTGRDPRNKTTFNLGIFKISNSVTSHSHLQMMSAKSQSFQDRSRAHPDDTRVGDRARIRQTADLPTRVRCHVRQTL